MSSAPAHPGRRSNIIGPVVFFSVAFFVPWGGWITLRSIAALGPLFEALSMIWLPAAVSLAGFLAALAEGGSKGLVTFARRALSLRLPWWVWPVSIVLPIVAGLLTFVTHPADLQKVDGLRWAPIFAAATLANLWTGPLAEEFGWRGYLLPMLSRRFNPVVAGLLIGPIWAAWHLPLFHDSTFSNPGSTLGFLVWIASWSVILAVVVTVSGGSVLPAVLTHWAMNAQGAFFEGMFPPNTEGMVPGGIGLSISTACVAAVIAGTWLWLERNRAREAS